MEVTTRTHEKIELPGAAQIRSWKDATERRQNLRGQFLETSEELKRTRTEVDRLATAALEIEARVLLGDAQQGELDRVNATAETATARIRDLEALSAKLKPQIENIEQALPKLRKEVDAAREQFCKAVRSSHERIVKRMAALLREASALELETDDLLGTARAVIGTAQGTLPGLNIRTMPLPVAGGIGQESDSNSAISRWLREARTYPGAGYDV